MRGVWDAEDLRKEREMGVLKKREAGDMGQNYAKMLNTIGRHMGQYCHSTHIGFNKYIRTIA